MLWVIFFLTLFLNFYIKHRYRDRILTEPEHIPVQSWGLVLGAKVGPDGFPTEVLEDRLATAADIFRSGHIRGIIVSGRSDPPDKDETGAMMAYLADNNIGEKFLICDSSAKTTFRSLKKLVEDDWKTPLIVFTQKFHLSRSLYLAQSMGLDAYGYVCDRRKYRKRLLLWAREKLATVKAFFVLFGNRKKSEPD